MGGPGMTPALTVCICTYRRAHLATTLSALSMVRWPQDGAVAVVVADNDITPSAEPLVTAYQAEVSFPVRYLHCPAGNIALARNAALAAAETRFIAFLDDDETPAPGWLDALWSEMQARPAAAVFGPVVSTYPPGTAGWMATAKPHSTRPVWVRGEIRTGYTGNVLLDTADPAVAGRRFDLRRGKTGGEDTAFFTEIHAAGGRLGFAEAAVVYEPVPEARARFGWLWARRLRFGQTHGGLAARNAGPGVRAGLLAQAGAKAAACFTMAALRLGAPGPRNLWSLRGALHLGTGLGVLGRGADRAATEPPDLTRAAPLDHPSRGTP